MRSHIESLEPRRLLSGWTTVDDYNFGPGGAAAYQAFTSDAAGDVYAVGRANDGNALHLVVREKASGTSTWNTVTDVSPSPVLSIVDAEVSPAGDLYVAGVSTNGRWIVTRQAAGQSDFTVVDQFGGGEVHDLTIDSNGNVFAVGGLAITTTVRKTQTTTWTWIVRKQTGGTGAFATVDSYRYAGTDSIANGATSIASGSVAGLYVVGSGNGHHLVRTSTDGGLTWSLVDDFTYPSGQASVADVVTGVLTPDGNSSVFVAGMARTSSGPKGNPILTTYWTVRKSSTGATGSWSLDNAVALSTPALNEPNSIQADLLGNVYVAGEQFLSATGPAHSVVRSNRGGSWQIEDDFQYTAGWAIATGLARDSAGNVFVAGYGQDPSDPNHDHGFIRAPVAAQSGQTFSIAPVGSSISGHDPLADLLGSDGDVLT